MGAQSEARRTAVAIVGIGCRFPGGANDAPALWRLLAEGRDAIREIPADRIDLSRYFDPKPATPGRIMSRWGGFVDQIEGFDAQFFGISPREAERLDPQHRLLLETAWEALEDAGQDPVRLRGSATGVFVGQWVSDFEHRLFADHDAIDFQMAMGSGRYASSGRVSYCLGLQGPSVTLDTACSSSLVSVLLAARSIRDGESTLALAGGVNLILQPHITLAYSQSRMMAADGHCKFGDARGDGYVRSEGAALVVLKSLDRAIEDGDRIYAVVRGGAINNDGASSGSMGRPSRIGQEELLRRAYHDAGIDPARVGYVEAHGTGTRAGDPVEMSALAKVLGEGRPAQRRGFVGSIKTNIGHTEGAAGIAGLVKAALCLHHEAIPPSLHFEQPNTAIDWDNHPLRIARQLEPWQRGDQPRIAGVMSFGIAGTNAHVVLEEAPPVGERASAATGEDDPGHALLVLSGRTPEALRDLARRYADWFESDAPPPLHGACWNAATRRAALEHRASFVASSIEGMAAELRRLCEGSVPTGDTELAAPRKVAFVVPGQGAQSLGMARELCASRLVFREALERCDAAARPFLGGSLLEQLHFEPGSPGYRLDQIDVIQPVLVALSIAYAALLRSIGIEPQAAVGHSMGEVGAACIAGALSLDDAMRVICRRSALMRQTSGQGAMALVELAVEEANARVRGREHELSVAVCNSPRSCVISGHPRAVADVMADLERDGVFCRLVKVDVASHSPQMDGVAAGLVSELADVRPAQASVSLYSTVLAAPVGGAELDAVYWSRNVRQPVQFAQTVSRMIDDGVTVFLELGPHPVLLPSVEQTAQSKQARVATVACGRRGEPDDAVFLSAIGALWAAGAAPDWSKVMRPCRDRLDLPLYPWQRERHWAEAADMQPRAGGGRTALRPDEESLRWLHALRWRELDAPSPARNVGELQWLLVSQDHATAEAWSAGLRAVGVRAAATSLDALAADVSRCARAGAEVRVIAVATDDDDDVPFLPARLVQALASAPQAKARVWYVTQGAQSTDASRPARVSIAQAALWGAARVVAEEHVESWGGLIDLDPALGTAENACALAGRLLAGDGEDQVALRGSRWFALRLVAERPEAASPIAWRADATYLITGGLGEVGLHIARTMAGCGARRIVLMGRTALPPRSQWAATPADSVAGRRIAGVRALEALGVAVHVANVDVADESQLRAYLDNHAAEAWPPIRGVVHAAGSLRNELSQRMDRDTFDAVVSPKLQGARLLDRLLPDLDFFVMFSSTGAFLAQPGQANYAAANAALDALATDRRARGLAAISIAWGVWRDTGLINNEAGARNVAEMARQGIQAFSPEQGARLFVWLASRPATNAIVLPIDWAAYRRARQGRPSPLMREMPDAGAACGEGGALHAQLAQASAAGRRQIVEGIVRDTVGRVLKIAASKLDARKALGSLGLNSLLAMELRNRLEAALQRPLSATLAWNHPTVEALVAHLAGDEAVLSAPAPKVAAERDAAGPDELDAVTQLSDDDIALALRGTRRGERV
jgi:acyl transferase domain-containing protein